MHRIVRWAGALAMALVMCLTSACVYMNVKQPLDTDLHETQLGTKVGKSEAQVILGLVAWGDAGTQAAARNGGITTLKHMDQERFSILGLLYARFRTIVYGD
jgi:hypothetical protein